MNQHSNPIDFLIEFAWASGADKFVVNNAKDELKKLRQEYEPVCWARINDRGDLFDPRLMLNPHLDSETVLPLYLNKKEYNDKLSK